MNKITTLFLALGLFAISCQPEPVDPVRSELDETLETTLRAAAPSGQMDYFRMPESNDYDAIPQDPNNPITDEKVELGQLLYHETGLAVAPKHSFSKGTYSCASCHFASAGFQAGRVQGIADGGIGFGMNGESRARGPLYQGDDLDCQPVRTPTAMNGAYQKVMLWNGQFGATGPNTGTEANWTVGTPIETNTLGFEGLETQAIAGLGVHRMNIADQPEVLGWYQDRFDEVFPDLPEAERYTQVTGGLAIAAYERTLLANQAPFQQWLKGDHTAMSEDEKRGAILFFDKAQCSTCHTGPALNSMQFEAVGMGDLHDCPEEIFRTLADDAAHKGRASFTKDEADNYKFKVPQLYNLTDSPFYGHGSSFRSIREVVEYKNAGEAQNPNVPTQQLSEHFKPLNLTPSEMSDLTAFLEFSLRDPNLSRYEPSSIPSGLCFPNNDPMSRNHLGCD